MEYNFEIVRWELRENEHGKNDLVIKQVKVLDQNGKYVKFAKLNQALLDAMIKKGIVTIKSNK